MGRLLKIVKPIGKFLTLPFTWLWGLIKSGTAGQLSRRAKRGLELFIVASVCGLLAWLNWQLGLEKHLAGPPAFRKVWLGLVALILYATVRFTMLLFAQLPKHASQFPDIAKALQAGVDAAFEARVSLQDSPLFLVLGAEESVEQAMVSSSFVGDRIKVDSNELPLHWHGDADAVWLTAPGVSAVSQQYGRVRGAKNAASVQARLTVAEKKQARQRLQYMAQLIKKLRSPVVPLNGVLLLIPYQWMEDAELSSMADTIKLDMATLQDAFGVKCMCCVIVHGIDQSKEFDAYIQSMPANARQRRCGCTLPAFAEYDQADGKALHGWLEEFLRQQVYRFYQADRTRASNGRLFRLLRSFHAIEPGFCRVLNNAFPSDVEEKFYLAGVYLAALDGSTKTFFDGVAAKLTGDHDECIGWNNQSLAKDRRTRRTASTLAGTVVLLITFNALLLSRMFFAW
ncbi:MAG: type VI secretion protein IcmF/TssM N-terminal domain-containing protein [Planctomycetaceae bacterium]